MITCNHCGRPTQAGMAQCQYCGSPVTSTTSGGGRGEAKMVSPELPTWLETLRAGERTSTPPDPNASSGYSADDFVDESLLPSWMQSERKDAVDNNPSGAIPLRRPASTPAPNTDNAFIPTKGMSASSFIDAQFLPSWLQEKQAATPNMPPESIAANSLVQQDALPEWMRTMPPQAQPPTAPSPLQYNQPFNTPQGIAGNDLIDQQAVPEWMAAQNPEVTSKGEAGFAASSLIDKDGLPSWMREGNQEQKRSSAEAFPPQQPGFAQPPHYQLPLGQAQVPYQPQMNGQMQAPGQQQQQPNDQPMMNSSLSAASFIDVNALPEWLRAPSVMPSPAQPGTVDNQRQSAFGVPPRPEYVRVPSRPRNEQGSSEESAVAANAFASMLGVASAAPFFPGQQQRDPSMGQASIPPQPAQNVPSVPIEYGAGIPGTPGTLGTSSPTMSSATWGAPPVQPMYAGQPGQQQPNQGFAPVQPQPPAGYQMGYAMNSMPGASSQQPVPSNIPAMVPPTYGEQPKTNTKPAKRGFLSTILDWFSRSS